VSGKEKSSRRKFLKASVTGLAGASVLPMAGCANGKQVVKPEAAGQKSSEKKEAEYKPIVRKLGNTGIELPVVSMGVMNADNPNLVLAALDAGMKHLDTAHYYQRGRNEEMIGKVVKDRPRDSFVLATKVVADGEDRRTGLFTEATKAGPFLEKFETSLKRLQMDYVDILYLHNIAKGQAATFPPLIEAMQKLKEQGKIRHIGVSTHKNEPEVIRAAADSGVYEVVLTAYNFRQPHKDEVKKAIDHAAGKGVGIVAMKTQAGVFWDKERTNPINMKAALKWALQSENVHTSIPGFTTFDQMKLDWSVMEDLALTPQETADLEPPMEKTGLFCPQCEGCRGHCREGLDVPTLMRSYMYAYGYKNLALAKDTLDSVDLPGTPCSSCESCTLSCTMGFDVREKIAAIVRLRDVPEDFLA
jgi:predicted aldo/keto reductase-like oxidoreductase